MFDLEKGLSGLYARSWLWLLRLEPPRRFCRSFFIISFLYLDLELLKAYDPCFRFSNFLFLNSAEESTV